MPPSDWYTRPFPAIQCGLSIVCFAAEAAGRQCRLPGNPIDFQSTVVHDRLFTTHCGPSESWHERLQCRDRSRSSFDQGRLQKASTGVRSVCSKADINKDERVTMNNIFRHSPEQPSRTDQRQGAGHELKPEIAIAHTVVPIGVTALIDHVVGISGHVGPEYSFNPIYMCFTARTSDPPSFILHALNNRSYSYE